MESTLVRVGCVFQWAGFIWLRSVIVVTDIILRLVLSDPGHSHPAVQDRTTSNYFSLPEEIVCLETLINVDALIMELVDFSISAMFWTKKIILTFDP